jgi:hypothetical protein
MLVRIPHAEIFDILLTDLGDNEENVNKYIDSMAKMYNTARKMKLEQRRPAPAEPQLDD